MLDSLNITGFKLFSKLEIPRLSRLNLFVGSNNAGKSCLLEAIRLYATNGSPLVIRELVRSRDGDWEANLSRRQMGDEDLATDIETPMRFLFHDFHCEGNPEAVIEIGPTSGSEDAKRVRLSLGLYRTLRSDEGGLRRLRIDVAEESTEDAEEMLEVFIGGDRRRLLRLESLWGRRYMPSRAFVSDDFPSPPTVTVGTNGISAEEISFLWDQVSLTPEQEEILECLRLIESRIEGLALIGDASRNGERERIPVIRVKGSTERFPLRTMGDGLTRLFHIALSIVNARDGVVLIDEFENGLYWEVQEQLWPLIFRMAQTFNVQVFATSHSTDCVRSFANAWEKSPDLGAMYRLERAGTSAQALSYL